MSRSPTTTRSRTSASILKGPDNHKPHYTSWLAVHDHAVDGFRKRFPFVRHPQSSFPSTKEKYQSPVSPRSGFFSPTSEKHQSPRSPRSSITDNFQTERNIVDMLITVGTLVKELEIRYDVPPKWGVIQQGRFEKLRHDTYRAGLMDTQDYHDAYVSELANLGARLERMLSHAADCAPAPICHHQLPRVKADTKHFNWRNLLTGKSLFTFANSKMSDKEVWDESLPRKVYDSMGKDFQNQLPRPERKVLAQDFVHFFDEWTALVQSREFISEQCRQILELQRDARKAKCFGKKQADKELVSAWSDSE